MPTDLLAELTQEAADSSRRKARYVRAFTAGVETGASRIDRKGLESRARESVLQLIRSGADDQRLWESGVLFPTEGVCPTSLWKIMLDEFREAFDAWLVWDQENRHMLDTLSARGITVGDQLLRELDETRTALTGARSTAERLLAALDRPRPEIDPTRLAEGRRAAADGRTLKSEDAIAAVRAVRK